MAALFCAMCTSLMFGFSRNLTWAVTARALSGAANGNVGILRTTVAELVPEKSLQPKAFSIMPLIWQIGSIVGPILGGALASPAVKLPNISGKIEFFKTFPYALPNLVSGVFFTIGISTGILFLRESLESRKHQKDYGRIVGSYLTQSCRRRRAPTPLEDDAEHPFKSKPKNITSLAPPAFREVFNPQSNLSLLAYCFLALHAVAYDQLVPVFMHLPPDAHVSLPFRFASGFGLDSGRIGVLFTIYGIFSMVCQFTVFPYMTTKLGALYCMRACTLVFPIAYILTPYTVLMPTPWSRQAAILGVMLLKGIAGVFAFPCITILLTNSAKSLRLLGTLNGVATSLSAIGRAAGPFFAGQTFTWGVEAGYGVAPWFLLAGFAVLGHVNTWWLMELEGFGTTARATEAGDEHEQIGLTDFVDTSQGDRPKSEAYSSPPESDEEDDDAKENDTLLRTDSISRVSTGTSHLDADAAAGVGDSRVRMRSPLGFRDTKANGHAHNDGR